MTTLKNTYLPSGDNNFWRQPIHDTPPSPLHNALTPLLPHSPILTISHYPTTPTLPLPHSYCRIVAKFVPSTQLCRFKNVSLPG